MAAGHHATAGAAATVLRRGGNAFDAAIAAGFAAAIAEPFFTSPAGGGFLTARTAEGAATVFDFFVAAPCIDSAEPHDPAALEAVAIRFDQAVQVFHVGPASVATPGCLAGYLHVHDRLGRLELAEVVAPAVELARRGVVVNAPVARVAVLLGEVLALTPTGRELYFRGDRPVEEGDVIRNEAMAAFLEEVATMGRSFRASDLGGQVTDRDLASYQVIERDPLEAPLGSARVLTNPPPSFGGRLISHALDALELAGAARRDGPARTLLMCEALLAQAELRHQLGPGAVRGTTHVSVADSEGNVASMTTSNGSGSGHFADGTGVQLNNMMGEEDLHPGGFGAPVPGERIGSMMAPSIVERADGSIVAVGSGGSERIRSTLTQVIAGLADPASVPGQVVAAPRLHWDGLRFQTEPGLGDDVAEALRARWELNVWATRDLFFGGAHTVCTPDIAVGDDRRGGVGITVSR